MDMFRLTKIRIAMFLALITAPALLAVFQPPRSISGIEKRALAPTPAFRWNPLAWGPMAEAFESYFNDRFGFREPLVRSYNYLMLKTLGKSPVPKVVAGREGWLYTTEYQALDDYRGIVSLSAFQLDTWKQAFETKRAWLAERGIRYLFAAAPDKTSIYPEFVPERYSRTGGPSRLDRVRQALGPAGRCCFLDLRQPLRDARADAPLFYRTDVHWTQAGAFTGYAAIMHVLSGWYPELTALSTADLELGEENRPGGDLAGVLGLSGIFREQAPTLTPKHPRARPMPIDLASVPPNKYYARSNPEGSLRVVVFHDSMCVYMEPWLSEHFAQAIYVARDFDYQVMEEILAAGKPDLVIEESHEAMLFGGLAPAEYHLHQGNRFASIGRFEPAVSQFREAVSLRPDLLDARINLGNALDQTGFLEEAVAVYRQALDLGHDNPDLLANLGAALLKKDQPGEAVTCLLLALKADPGHAAALFNMGGVYMREGKNDEALDFFSRAVARQPDMIDAHLQMGRLLLAMRRYGDAIDRFETALKLSPGNPGIVSELERAKEVRDRSLTTLENKLREDLQKNPGNPDAHYQLGAARQMAEDFQAAAGHYEKALALRPEYPEALFNLGRVYTRLNRLDKALVLYGKLAVLRPDIPDTFYNMACLHAMRNEPDAAVERLRQAVTKGFNAWQALRTDPDIANIRSTPYVRSLLEQHAAGNP